MVPKVSVIVPIYNVGPYISHCLDSLAAQTLRDIEIILIDDGSTDGSGRTADQYAAQDDRFLVVHQPNRGLSAARNAGIELAKADHLMFVDSDDWVEPDFCRIPYEIAAEDGADLVIFRSWRKKTTGRERCSPPLGNRLISREEAMGLLYHGAGVAAWNKLYHRRLFADIRYPEGRVYEDKGTTHRLMQKAECIMTTDAVLYHYRIRKDSISHTHTEQNNKDWLQMNLLEADDLKAFGYSDLAEERVSLITLGYLIRFGIRAERSDEFLSLLRKHTRPTPKDPWKRKFLLLLLRVCPPLFDLICILFGKRRWKRTAGKGENPS